MTPLAPYSHIQLFLLRKTRYLTLRDDSWSMSINSLLKEEAMILVFLEKALRWMIDLKFWYSIPNQIISYQSQMMRIRLKLTLTCCSKRLSGLKWNWQSKLTMRLLSQMGSLEYNLSRHRLVFKVCKELRWTLKDQDHWLVRISTRIHLRIFALQE